MNLYRTYLQALGYPERPSLFLDEVELLKNISWVKSNAGGKNIRLATKSIRCKSILKKILDIDPIFHGLMTYDLREALWLRDQGFKNILMGYPTLDKSYLQEIAKNPSEIILMVDRSEHLKTIRDAAKETKKTINICVDIDLSLDLPGIRFGVFRSSLRDQSRMSSFIQELKKFPELNLVGLMGYEAQIAGVMDKESALMRTLKRLSLGQLQKRRKDFVGLLKSEGFNLELINGGGTGSLLDTRKEDIVTEITVGSGFYSPVLFDHYSQFKLNPALFFTLPIIRRPENHIFTCFGGGYIASGEINLIKQPTPFLPEGAKLLKHEGAGEVQTPFEYRGSEILQLGDSLIMRHAKAGEICERFEEIQIINNGKISETVLTYRGEGKTFV